MGRPTTISDARILDAARVVFLERGIRATTADVARRAGVAEGSIFHRFPTKRDLFRAAMRPELDDAAWRRALASPRDAADDGATASPDENTGATSRTDTGASPRGPAGERARPAPGRPAGERARAAPGRPAGERARTAPGRPADERGRDGRHGAGGAAGDRDGARGPQPGDARATMRAIAHAVVALLRPRMPLLMMGWSNPDARCDDGAGSPTPRRAVRDLARVFAVEMEAGRLRRRDPEVLARAFLGSLQSFVFFELLLRARDERAPDEDQFVGGLVDLLWSGADAGAPPDRRRPAARGRGRS